MKKQRDFLHILSLAATLLLANGCVTDLSHEERSHTNANANFARNLAALDLPNLSLPNLAALSARSTFWLRGNTPQVAREEGQTLGESFLWENIFCNNEAAKIALDTSADATPNRADAQLAQRLATLNMAFLSEENLARTQAAIDAELKRRGVEIAAQPQARGKPPRSECPQYAPN